MLILKHKNKIIIQKEGLAMGAPSSAFSLKSSCNTQNTHNFPD